MQSAFEQISRNLEQVNEDIAKACARVGRTRDSVALVAVTKYADWPWVEALVKLGLQNLGESRPQQLLERSELLDSSPNVHWHLIGHLQRNKVRPMLGRVFRFHSADSFKLLDRMELLAAELDVSPKVLLEVNLSGEASKDGFAAVELESQWQALTKFSRVQITGLMTMAPYTIDEDVIRDVFRNLRQLRDHLETQSEGKLSMPELSMGMSHDFEIAIEEGATHIRIGSRLFEGLEPTGGH
jgi:pyridoxal phosphate enzyme (YggS family)